MSRLEDIIREIHRRSLWQVLLIYCGAALVAYQAVQALTEGLGLPQWFPAFAIELFIVGLPLVLATAFVRDVASPAEGLVEATPPREAATGAIESQAAAVHLASGRRLRFLTWRNAFYAAILTSSSPFIGGLSVICTVGISLRQRATSMRRS